ncbi:hypothetical protein LJ739_05560 [Aestuariibacter halophilus]|uniref:Uncharacterized protein n=1 Tax=Fluctibacter halophilus TaxID=226011 RepID=A0ABS8G543_9ALTE|nr:hypothetical protein [Aestuariibacter halophilus]MCC2615702.1 hypothetical protein [Aestuariibacter halophilus]
MILIVSLGQWLSNDDTGPVVQGTRCTLEQGGCTFETGGQRIRISLDSQTVPLETLFTLHMTYPHSLTFKQAWIEGVNMFMGKMQVVPLSQPSREGENTTLDAESFLGSCSEPHMEWRMVVEFVQEEKQPPLRLELYFDTQRSGD